MKSTDIVSNLVGRIGMFTQSSLLIERAYNYQCVNSRNNKFYSAFQAQYGAKYYFFAVYGSFDGKLLTYWFGDYDEKHQASEKFSDSHTARMKHGYSVTVADEVRVQKILRNIITLNEMGMNVGHIEECDVIFARFFQFLEFQPSDMIALNQIYREVKRGI